MREIILTFNTKKGEKAYHEVEADGKAQSYMDRKIGKAVARDKITSKKPLTVQIKVKVRRLAIATKLDEQIVLALKKKGAKKGIDYEMEVSY